MWISSKQYDALLEDNARLQKRLDDALKTEKKYTDKDMDNLKGLQKEAVERLTEEHKHDLKEKERQYDSLYGDYTTLGKEKDKNDAVLAEYTEALQKMANDRGANDIALLIINDIKNFDTFKKDFTEITTNKITAEYEKKYQEKITKTTEGNMNWVQGMASKSMGRALSNNQQM